MDNKPIETPEDYPTLGRWMNWVDQPGNDLKIFFMLCVICLICFGMSFTFTMHGYFEMEEVKGFYALFGFVMFSGLIFVATCLRIIVKRREDYYGAKSIDTEDYPEDQLERLEHDV